MDRLLTAVSRLCLLSPLMNAQAQRIAIAEACGFKPVKRRKYAGQSNVIGWEKVNPVHGCKDFIRYPIQLPDYLNSLDLMHEAEKTLSPREREVYASILSGDPTVPSPDSYIGYIEFPAADVFEAFIHASAAQRAEAFLRTLGKWE